MFVDLEQLGIAIAIESGVLQEQKRGAGIDDAVCVRTKVVGGLADHGHAAKVLPYRLDGSERTIQELLILHRREDLLDENVLGDAKVRRDVQHVVDAPK